jgi:hypothetical protein
MQIAVIVVTPISSYLLTIWFLGWVAEFQRRNLKNATASTMTSISESTIRRYLAGSLNAAEPSG